MASRNFTATGDPQAVETVLSLTVGRPYYLQNVDPVASLRFRDAAVKPPPTMRAHIIASGGSIVVTPTENTKMWAWTDDGTCACIVSDA